jgi:hypothetical protein
LDEIPMSADRRISAYQRITKLLWLLLLP